MSSINEQIREAEMRMELSKDMPSTGRPVDLDDDLSFSEQLERAERASMDTEGVNFVNISSRSKSEGTKIPEGAAYAATKSNFVPSKKRSRKRSL